MPQGVNDERLKNRELLLIKDSWISVMYSENVANPLISDDPDIPKGKNLFPDDYFQTLWDKGLQSDEKFKLLYRAVSANNRSFPPDLSDIKVSLSECKFNSKGVLTFRDRIWILCYEPLHPGRDSTLLILSRIFFWPGLSKDDRRFGRNCDVYGRSHVWRERNNGLLRPLPVADRFNSEIAIDFMTDLPAKFPSDP